MNDYSKLSELNQHLEHIKTIEEANDFCHAYGEALEKYAMDKEKEMDESGEREEASHLLIILTVVGIIIAAMTAAESESWEAIVILKGLLYGVILPTVAKCLGRINCVRKLTTLASGFKNLDELKGLTEERALDYTNNLVDRYNRLVDDDGSNIVYVYNGNYVKNPEKGANIAIAAMGILVFLLIVFCVIKELTGI